MIEYPSYAHKLVCDSCRDKWSSDTRTSIGTYVFTEIRCKYGFCETQGGREHHDTIYGTAYLDRSCPKLKGLYQYDTNGRIIAETEDAIKKAREIQQREEHERKEKEAREEAREEAARKKREQKEKEVKEVKEAEEMARWYEKKAKKRRESIFISISLFISFVTALIMFFSTWNVFFETFGRFSIYFMLSIIFTILSIPLGIICKNYHFDLHYPISISLLEILSAIFCVLTLFLGIGAVTSGNNGVFLIAGIIVILSIGLLFYYVKNYDLYDSLDWL